MKAKLTIIAALGAAAFLTPAYASTILYSDGSTTGPMTVNGSSQICVAASGSNSCTNYVGATGWENIFQTTYPTTGAPVFTGTGTKTTPIVSSSNGLGLNPSNSDTGQIGTTDGIVLDFSSSTGPGASNAGNLPTNDGSITGVSITISEENGGNAEYMFYGYNGTSWALLGSGADGGSPNTASIDLTATSGMDDPALYTEYAVGLTGDCSIELTDLSITYSGVAPQNTPEPGTFVMAGFAMLGLGVALRKRGRKA